MLCLIGRPARCVRAINIGMELKHTILEYSTAVYAECAVGPGPEHDPAGGDGGI
jgi:hypothetical protein